MPSPPAVSVAAQELYAALGPLTAGDGAAGWPLLILCQTLVLSLDEVDSLCRDTAAGVGWSQVLDPTRAPAQVLPWLGQFVGTIVDTTLSLAGQRAQIIAETGLARGTPAVLIATAQRFLSGAKTVTLLERTTDAYHLTVQVPGAQLQSTTYNQLSSTYATYNALATAFATYNAFSSGSTELLAALNAVKPAGLIIALQVT